MVQAEADDLAHVLEEHHGDRALVAGLERRRLGVGLTLLIWALRAYVLFMAVVVAINVAETVH